MIRNSGGLAVALDGGVLNLSLVIPGIHEVSIHDCYEAMVSFVQYMLQDLTNEIEAYEIVHSYCPGDYDLSINGKKFAGISQRRVRDGAAVQIYLDVEGNSYERANLIRDFYRISKKEEETKFTYPEVDPNVMASLSKLLQTNLTVEKMKDRVQAALRNFSEKIVETSFSESERDVFEKDMHKWRNGINRFGRFWGSIRKFSIRNDFCVFPVFYRSIKIGHSSNFMSDQFLIVLFHTVTHLPYE